MISNSGHDENGRYSGGRAGDQGGEWAVINWYNRPWNCILRYPNSAVGEKIAELARQAANNDLIGYDQNERYTFWEHLVASGYYPSKITVACEADCSAGVIAITRAAGHLLGIDALKTIHQSVVSGGKTIQGATYTGNMRDRYRAAGFQVLTDSKYLTSDAYLLPGDILLNDSHHTAINLDKGSKITSTSTETAMGMTLTDIAKYVNAEFGTASSYGENGYKCLLGVAQCMKDMAENGGYGNTLSAVLKNNFTTPSSTYTPECLQAVKDVFVNGKKRFDNAKILQFRSFSKYSDGKGNPDKTKCASLYAKYDYIGSDSISLSLGHLYFGKFTSSSSTLNETEKWAGMINADAPVRTWAGTSYKECSFSPLKKGVKVSVLDTVKASKGADWYYIRYDGKTGFTHSKYVSQALPEADSTVKNDPPTSYSPENKVPYMVKITASSLNIRKGAGTEYDIVGCIKDRGVYTIIEEKDGWGYLKSKVGWIFLDYTQKI